MKLVKELAALIEGAVIKGDKETKVTGMEHDSRKVAHGTMFVCIPGAHVDGHDFIPQAEKAGAKAILTTREDIEGGAIAAGSVIEGFRHTRNGCGRCAGFFLDSRIRTACIEHARYLQALAYLALRWTIHTYRHRHARERSDWRIQVLPPQGAGGD